MPRAPFRSFRRSPRSTHAALAGPVIGLAFVVTAGASPVGATGTPAATYDDVATARVTAASEPGLAPRIIRLKVERAHQTELPGKDKRAARTHQQRGQQAVVSGSPERIGRALAAKRSWTGSQWSCLDALWTRESGWQAQRSNPSSGAYGIPQALPGSKMAAAGADWRTNPATQIRWGLDYISGRYGTPCTAWSTFQSRGWY